MDNKKYIVYRIENLKNSKSYIGCHITNDINDSYMGSGKLIKLAINKYGIDNFKKQILFVFDNEIDMFGKEKALIKQLNPEYNLHEGGNGGFTFLNSTDKPRRQNFTILDREKATAKLKLLSKDVKFADKKAKAFSKTLKDKNIDMRVKGNFGRKFSEETRRKMSDSHKGKQSPIKGTKRSDITKNKISNSLKSYYKSKNIEA